MDLSPWESAGLYDPEAPDADKSRAVLEYLDGLGLSADDALDAARNGRLGRLAADHVLWHDAGPTLTVHDLAARSGMDEARVRAILRASGQPDSLDEPVYRDVHVQLLGAFAFGAQIFNDDAMLQYARVLGSASARVAEAALALFFANVSPQLRLSEASDLELVRRSAEAVSAFSATPAAMDLLIREHFVTAVRRAGLLDVREGGTSLGTIAFIDLVASTETSRAVTAAQWSDALTVFETAAMDAIQARDGRVVKLIGDEAMLFAPTPAAAIDAVDEVLTTVERHPLLGGGRAGVAAGYVVSRDGDYFGPVVNLAARLVGAAAAGEVLLNDEASRSVAEGGYPIDAAGDFTLKGFEQPVPVARFRR